MPDDQQKTTSPLADEAAAFRRFNRMYTRLIGTLNESILDSGHTLGEARLLFELATRTEPKASDIAEELRLDQGYLSRLLKKFEHAGLLKKETSEQDGRYAELKLTPQGKSAFARLNALSQQQALSLLEKLAPTVRTKLFHSMRVIEEILMPVDPGRRTYVLRPPRVGDMGWVVHRESVGYAEQYGWDHTFEALVARVVESFITNFDSNRERCWIAEVNGQQVGHVFLVNHPSEPDTAKLRLLFVEPSARGMGLGNVLVNECLRFARTVGYRRVVLRTQSILTAAHHLYKKAGFRLVKEEPHHSFGQDLIGQEWELDLT